MPERSAKMLGVGVGSEELRGRIALGEVGKQRDRLDMLGYVPGKQRRFSILLNCLLPRSNHFVQSNPMHVVKEAVETHDVNAVETFEEHVLGTELVGPQRAMLSLPFREGGED